MKVGAQQPRAEDSLEWWCRLTLQCLAASFAIVGTLFFVVPDGTVSFMNAVGAALGNFTTAPPSALRFWLSLTTGYMVMVTALAYMAQRDLQRRRDFLLILALGKATSSLTCLLFFVFSLDAFIYLANFLVDGSITLMALAIWALVPAFTAASTSDCHADTAARAFGSILEAMVPPGGAFEAGAQDGTLAHEIEGFIAGSSPAAPRAFRVLLQLFDVSPYFLPPFHLRRFSQLELQERVHILAAWERSGLMPRRQLMHTLKLVIMSHFYSHPEIEAKLGYVHPLDRVPLPEVVP